MKSSCGCETKGSSIIVLCTMHRHQQVIASIGRLGISLGVLFREEEVLRRLLMTDAGAPVAQKAAERLAKTLGVVIGIRREMLAWCREHGVRKAAQMTTDELRQAVVKQALEEVSEGTLE